MLTQCLSEVDTVVPWMLPDLSSQLLSCGLHCADSTSRTSRAGFPLSNTGLTDHMRGQWAGFLRFVGRGRTRTMQEAAAVVGGDLEQEGVLGVAGAAGVAPHGVVPVRAGADGLQAPPE